MQCGKINTNNVLTNMFKNRLIHNIKINTKLNWLNASLLLYVCMTRATHTSIESAYQIICNNCSYFKVPLLYADIK